MNGERSEPPAFAAHIDLLQQILADRRRIADRIGDLLNAQRRPESLLRDRELLSRLLDQCFFESRGLNAQLLALKAGLEATHRARGFMPRQGTGLVNDVISPAELMLRAFYCWQQSRWPGRNGRRHYAGTVFNLWIIHYLVLLSLRIWDGEGSQAGERFTQLQSMLDALWAGTSDEQPRLVRDARWLPALAQAPTTDELGGYFDVARNVAEALPAASTLAIAMAHVHVLGGHLTSQMRHYCIDEGLEPDARSIVLRTRSSNALDFALLVQGLVPVLEAYAQACRQQDGTKRLALAAAILQGISPDPEVFIERLDLLGPYSMIEELFVEQTDDQTVVYSAPGRRHLRCLERYVELIRAVVESLQEDCLQLRPESDAYSPYGALFGTPTNLLEHIALKAIDREAVAGWGLDDVFTAGGADKVAWVNGWRQLPHIPAAMQQHWAYPADFAAGIQARIEAVLDRCVAATTTADATGRLQLVSADAFAAPEACALSSDRALVAAGGAQFCDQDKLLRDRREGYFLVSFKAQRGWVALKKDLLTEVLGAGEDAIVAGLPAAAADALRLLCPGIETR